MEDSIDTLASEVSSLTQKLDGIGIEIYHLNGAICSLKSAIERLANKDED